MCHWNTFSSLIEVLLQACVNVPLEIILQEYSYFQQVLYVEFLPDAFFQSKVRKIHFYAWRLDFILKLPIGFIHSCVYCCLRLLHKIACSRNLLGFSVLLQVGSEGWTMNKDRSTWVHSFNSTQDEIMYDAFHCILLDVW